MRELGDPSADTVLLVHGIGVSARYFRPLATALAADHRVLVPDLPGFGQSPRPDRPPTVEELARLLLRLLELRGAGRATLVGHSMGAQVVAAMARRAPEAVGGVLLVGPVVDPSARSAPAQGWRLLRDSFHEPPRVNAVIASDYVRTGPRWYSAVLPHMLAFDTSAAVARADVPVLVVRGQHDRVASRAWCRALTDTAPQGELREVPGTGHVAMATDPGPVSRWVRELRATDGESGDRQGRARRGGAT
ncbi:alpha/beta hydrolase [Isoptericola sp. 4D.3]|uniref:Alpha/beta hydrolase n=1 Tax=Isoptericola peretonis TaxID=2918523 RepID=A0ABT0J2F3_9MICO|nr:alpha/beta hydrolase [Isoptericola sp. 4D.3]